MFPAEQKARAEARQLARERGEDVSVLYSHKTKEFKLADPWQARLSNRLEWANVFTAKPRPNAA
jgi:hypothetical protein